MPDTTREDILTLQAEVSALRMALAFLVCDTDGIGDGGSADFVLDGLMGQHATAAGKDARLCFAIEDICEMIRALRDA
ncbi:hypothetical protein [Sagittula sp. S175]|uniref:hypothetical protein n=1 Tax=Sagittula sp. S175 TaxID=3415129 RepID=UPI003C7AC4F9